MSYHSATLSLLLQFLFHVAAVVGGVVLHTGQLLTVKSTKVLREDIVKQSVEDQKAKDLHDDFRHVVFGVGDIEATSKCLRQKDFMEWLCSDRDSQSLAVLSCERNVFLVHYHVHVIWLICNDISSTWNTADDKNPAPPGIHKTL